MEKDVKKDFMEVWNSAKDGERVSFEIKGEFYYPLYIEFSLWKRFKIWFFKSILKKDYLNYKYRTTFNLHEELATIIRNVNK